MRGNWSKSLVTVNLSRRQSIFCNSTKRSGIEVEAGEDLEVDQIDDLGDLYIETGEINDWERADL